MTTFNYQPLASDSFRLLHLDSGPPHQPLSATLVHESLDSRPIYKALSYVWGPPENFSWLELGDGGVQIRHNLQLALRALRDHHGIGVIWVDMICINQNDIEERNSQVSLMHRIYEQAEEVLVWMGEGDVFTELAFDSSTKIGLARGLPLSRHQVFDPEKITAGIVASNCALNAETMPRPGTDLAREDELFLEVKQRVEIIDSTPGCEVRNPDLRHISGFRGYQMQEVLGMYKLLRALDLDFSEYQIRKTLKYSVVREPMGESPVRWAEETLDPEAKDLLTSFDLAAPIDVVWYALCTIFSREWFNRVWMIQEVVLAQKPTVVIGGYTLPWDMLMLVDQVFWELGVFPSRNNRASHHAVQMDIRRDDRKANRELQLLSLLMLSRESDCSVPHDKFFAVLGLAGTKHSEVLKVDYRLDLPTLFKSVAAYHIQSTGILEILLLVDSELSPDLPSWVPDWRLPGRGMVYLYQAMNAGYSAGREIHEQPYADIAAGKLRLRGKLVGVIHKTSVRFQLVQIGSTKRLARPVTNPNAVSRMYESTMLVFEAWMNFCVVQCPDPYPTGEDLISAFWKTLVCGGNEWTSEHEMDAIQQIIRRLFWSEFPFQRIPSLMKLMYLMMNRTYQPLVWNGSPSFWVYAAGCNAHKRLFCLQNGLIGTGPIGTREGDLVYVFEGAATPFVARQLGGKTILLGPTYVHGIMNGEWLEYDKSPSQEILLS